MTTIPRSKAELAALYGFSGGYLAQLLNDPHRGYYKELVEVGYHKRMILLTPKIVRKFIECHGEPLSPIDFEV